MSNLLRPEQRSEMLSERESLQAQLHNPNIQDKGLVARQLRRLEHQLETQTPKPYAEKEIDQAVKLEKELRSQLVEGMPSHEEMRKAPPGAVGKHMAWEKRNKAKLLKWKEVQLRLNAGTTDPDVANFERHRPKTSTLSMDNAQISGQSYFMPPTSPAYAEGYDRIFNKPAPERFGAEEATPAETKPKKRKGTMSPEARQRASERMKARHAELKAAQEAKEPKEG